MYFVDDSICHCLQLAAVEPAFTGLYHSRASRLSPDPSVSSLKPLRPFGRAGSISRNTPGRFFFPGRCQVENFLPCFTISCGKSRVLLPPPWAARAAFGAAAVSASTLKPAPKSCHSQPHCQRQYQPFIPFHLRIISAFSKNRSKS